MGNAGKHTKWQCAVAPRFYQAPTLTVASGKGSKTVLDTVGKSKFKKKGKGHIIEDPIEAHEALKILEKLWNLQLPLSLFYQVIAITYLKLITMVRYLQRQMITYIFLL